MQVYICTQKDCVRETLVMCPIFLQASTCCVCQHVSVYVCVLCARGCVYIRLRV